MTIRSTKMVQLMLVQTVAGIGSEENPMRVVVTVVDPSTGRMFQVDDGMGRKSEQPIDSLIHLILTTREVET